MPADADRKPLSRMVRAPQHPPGFGQPACDHRSFAFGPFLLKPEQQVLLKRLSPVRIGGRSLDILTTLVERPGEVVDKRTLIARVWPNTFVEEDNLKVNVANLRRVLQDNPSSPRFIATVMGRGYRFIAPVHATGSLASLLRLSEGTPSIVELIEAMHAIRQHLARISPGVG